MSDIENRRDFLAKGTLVAAGLLGGTAAAQESAPGKPHQHEHLEHPPGHQMDPQFQEYSRFKPSYGGPPGSDTYLGKMVPGRTQAGQAPVPVTSPDLEKLSFTMKGGVKEFHLHPQPVKRELLPGYFMDFYGYNGTMPGPVIEVFQGDRIRVIVHNELPEPTTVHWHGVELPAKEDGVEFLTQDAIPPGKSYTYEFTLHQTGTFFYHSHFAMQEAFGTIGLLIVHPRIAFDPVVDRDFALIFQNFTIRPNQTISDSWAMEWNWHTINGRSGPYTTPLVVRHGERVRIRLLNFSPEQHHPLHFHGHTFWLTGTEAGRIPPSAWIPRNTTLTGVAMVQEIEFIAFNPGDWMLHCHMVHHMMNHMVRQVGPRIREGVTADDYLQNLEVRPPVQFPPTDPGFRVKGYPQNMMGMNHGEMQKVLNRREVQGLRNGWPMAVEGMMTLVRVLPDELYEKVMNTAQKVAPGSSVPGAGPGMPMEMHQHSMGTPGMNSQQPHNPGQHENHP